MAAKARYRAAVLEAEVILNAVSDPQVPDIEAGLVRVSLLIARHDAEEAVALALNLADIDTTELSRGTVLVEGDCFQTASMFEAELWIRNGEKTINGKSIMGVLTLAASKGTVLVIEADGPDREDALQAVYELIN